jgi:lipoprotein-anchoring transpeptidase ErfK/SrfK
MHQSPALISALAAALVLGAALPSFAAAEIVSFATAAVPGTVVIETAERRLYLVLPRGQALRYVVGVGRQGRQWSGTSSIAAKYLLPNWAPPAAIRHDTPSLPDVIAGGSPANPMGAAAMTLAGTAYAIHGTNSPKSIGGFVSYGCIRMFNEDIADLFTRVRVGTAVVVEP